MRILRSSRRVSQLSCEHHGGGKNIQDFAQILHLRDSVDFTRYVNKISTNQNQQTTQPTNHPRFVPGLVTNIGAPRSSMRRIALFVSSLPSPVMIVGAYRLVPLESATTNDPLWYDQRGAEE